MKKRITIKDIAKYAGVSIATVSRVINSNGYVSESTRKKVYNAIKRFNYKPSQIAKLLKTKLSPFIGLLINKIDNPFTSVLVSSIEKFSKNYKLKLIFSDNEGSNSDLKNFISLFDEMDVSGLILHLPYFTESEKILLDSFNIPYVLVSVPVEFDDVSFICIDNYSIGSLGAKILKSSGYKNIGIIGGKIFNNIKNDSFYRLKGFLETWGYFNYNEFLKNNYKETDFSYFSGYKAAEELYKKHNGNIDAFFCFSDLLGIAAVNFIRTNNLIPGKDIGVLGVDNLYIRNLSAPFHLSSIGQPVELIGQHAVEIINKKINGDKEVYQVVLKCSYIKGKTLR